MPAQQTIVHHGFEMSPREFHDLKAWPTPGGHSGNWHGSYASQSPTDAIYVTREGGGAEGTRGYLALPGADSDQFYAEASPIWERPQKTYDLRNTRVTVYLKAITPLRIAEGYHPYIFIDDWCEETKSLCGWYHRQKLNVGNDWTFNAVDLVNDETKWLRYSNERPLDTVLARVGFIGVMYLNGINFKGVRASGILGMDELKFNIPRNG